MCGGKWAFADQCKITSTVCHATLREFACFLPDAAARLSWLCMQPMELGEKHTSDTGCCSEDGRHYSVIMSLTSMTTKY
jgi:hypothetical protein